DGKTMSVSDVLKSRQLAPLVVKAADLADPSFPPPSRYRLAPPGPKNTGSGAGDEAEIKESDAKDEKQSVESEVARPGEKEALNWPNAAERIGFGPWVKFKDVGEPLPEPGASKIGPVPGHFGFVTNLMAAKGWSREKIKEMTTPCLQLDPRSAVALYRTGNFL